MVRPRGRWSIVLVLATLACTAAPSAPAPRAAAAAPAASPLPLRRLELPAGTVSATTTPLWAAVEQGLFRRHGLDVEVTGMAAAAATQAVQTKTVPFAATTASSVTAFANGARNLVIFAGLLNKVLFQLIAHPDIARGEDLRGKSVGASAPGSTAAIALGATLPRYGLEPERDVTIVHLRDQPAILAGLLNAQVAAGMISNPYNQQALAQGYRLLFDTADSDIEILGLHLTTTRGVLEREPDLVRRFLMGYVEAIQYTRQDRAGTIEVMMRGTRNDDRAVAEEAYALYRRIWDPWPSERALQTLLDNLDLPAARDVRPEQVIDASALRELEASGWLGQHLGPP